jgi:hypothetical protein
MPATLTGAMTAPRSRSAASREVRVVCAAFAKGLRTILAAKLHGAYVYGAVAFPDRLPTHDIDFHVILNGSLTKAERSALEELHESLSRCFPRFGGELDGYYILLRDTRRVKRPRSQMWQRAADDSWALHCEHVRAGRCIVLHGPDPKKVYPRPSWRQVDKALRGELRYIERHLRDYPDYCILNLCRLVYSYETGDVAVSKAAASVWACDALPEWRRPIRAARRSYAGRLTPPEREFMLAEVKGLFESARARIEAARKRTRKGNPKARVTRSVSRVSGDANRDHPLSPARPRV